MDKGTAPAKKGRKKQRPKRPQNPLESAAEVSVTSIDTSLQSTKPVSVVTTSTTSVATKSTAETIIDSSLKPSNVCLVSSPTQSENTQEHREGTPGGDSQEGSKSKNKKKHKKNKKKTSQITAEGKELPGDQACKEQNPITLQLVNTCSLPPELSLINKGSQPVPQEPTKNQSVKKSKKSRKRTNQNTDLNEECKILSNHQESCDNFLCTHKESECVKQKKVATEFSNKFDISSLHFLTENSFDFSKYPTGDEGQSAALPPFRYSEPDIVDFGKPLHPKPHILTEIEFTALDQLKNIRKLAHDVNLSERLFSTYSFKENQVSDCLKDLTVPVFTHSISEPVFSEELKLLQKNREIAREARQHFKPRNIFDLSNLTGSYADSPRECKITEIEEPSDVSVKTILSSEKHLEDPFTKDPDSIANTQHYFDYTSKSKFEPYSFATQDFASEITLFRPSISSLQQELKESTDQLKNFIECFPPEVESSTYGELKSFSDENNTSDSDSKIISPKKSTLFEVKSPDFSNFGSLDQPKTSSLSKESFNAAVGSKQVINQLQPSIDTSAEAAFNCQKLKEENSNHKTNSSNDSIKLHEICSQSEIESNYVLFESGNTLNDWYTTKCGAQTEQTDYPTSLKHSETSDTMENTHPKSEAKNIKPVSPVKSNRTPKKSPAKAATETTVKKMTKELPTETAEKPSLQPSVPSSELTDGQTVQKTKAELKAERRAIQEAQRASKADKKKSDGSSNQKKSEQDAGSPTSSTEAGEIVKSKAELRAERRALQEAQRAAKAAKKAEEGQKTAPKKPTATSASVEDSKESLPTTSDQRRDEKSSKESTPCSVTQVFPQRTKVQRKVQLFEHLHQYEREVSLTQGILFGSGTVHPAIIRLGLQYAEGVLCGSNARCVALLFALKEVIQDYITPPQKELSRDLEGKLERYSSFLQHCRPISVSMSNAIKFLKWQITHIPNGTEDHEAKKELLEAVDNYIQENVILADKAIAALAMEKISDGDVILTYSFSSVINSVLKKAHERGKKFRVVVMDGRPKMEGKKTLVCLIKQGIKCSYVLINAVSYIMREVTKVFLGAHALLANGYVMSRVGSSQIALVAKAYNVPVLVCCETHKFSERVQTDSFVFNELGDPDDLVQTHTKHIYLADWRDIASLNLLNLVFDVTSPDLITAVVTELGMIPCTSVPVVLRVKHPKN